MTPLLSPREPLDHAAIREALQAVAADGDPDQRRHDLITIYELLSLRANRSYNANEPPSLEDRALHAEVRDAVLRAVAGTPDARINWSSPVYMCVTNPLDDSTLPAAALKASLGLVARGILRGKGTTEADHSPLVRALRTLTTGIRPISKNTLDATLAAHPQTPAVEQVARAVATDLAAVQALKFARAHATAFARNSRVFDPKPSARQKRAGGKSK